jgi:hypothetical protein
MLEEVLALEADQVRVRWRGVDVPEDAGRRSADKHLGKLIPRSASAAEVEAFEAAVIGGDAGVGDDDMRERQRPCRGAWTGCARVLGVDAVVERIELQRGVAPEQDRVDARRSDAGHRFNRRRRTRNGDALALRPQWRRYRRRPGSAERPRQCCSAVDDTASGGLD